MSVSTLRAWERRYGVVTPSRTPAGYRLYDDESIERLRAMFHLITHEGWQPRQAAEKVVEPGVDLGSLGAASVASTARRPLEASTHDGSTQRQRSLVDAFVSAAHRLDVPAMERVLDESLASQRFELAFEAMIAPSLREIGDAWAAGDLDVAVEHAASETIRRRMARFFDAAGHRDRRPRVIVGMPPDGLHEIGGLAFAIAARRAGVAVLYLGSNVPPASWLRTVRDTSAPIVVLGVVVPGDVSTAATVIRVLQGSARPPICLVGGPEASALPAGSGAVALPDSLDGATATVVNLLKSGRRRAN